MPTDLKSIILNFENIKKFLCYTREYKWIENSKKITCKIAKSCQSMYNI